ncbi:MAG: universal stress protein [Cyclobacteriaceae bacterium]|nr:universal stress protein [Cyclobacteriaceae bacterium]
MKSRPKKQTLLVLIDFSQNAYKALKYAISLARVIDGKIILLYVASPRDAENTDIPSIALRAMDIDKSKAEGQLGSIIEMIEAEGLAVEYINTVGNLYSKITEYANLFSPNVIVLGKSNLEEKSLGGITEFLLNQNNDNVLIIDSDNEFNEDTQISVECNENNLSGYNTNFLYCLNENTNLPIYLFVNKKERGEKEFSLPQNWLDIQNSNHKICYKSNPYFSVESSINSHIEEKKIDLVCIGRKRMKTSFLSSFFNKANTTTNIIKSTHKPILIMGTTS